MDGKNAFYFLYWNVVQQRWLIAEVWETSLDRAQTYANLMGESGTETPTLLRKGALVNPKTGMVSYPAVGQEIPAETELPPASETGHYVITPDYEGLQDEAPEADAGNVDDD
jgi:hypothetical protein